MLLALYYGTRERSGLALAIDALLLPWLLIGILIINLPFIGAAFRRLSLPLEVRRNHALEHGTIYFLKKELPDRRIGGRGRGRRFQDLGRP
jgi:hypothetical protein